MPLFSLSSSIERSIARNFLGTEKFDFLDLPSRPPKSFGIAFLVCKDVSAMFNVPFLNYDTAIVHGTP